MADDFEGALRHDLPRGVPGKPDQLPRARWIAPEELGPAWRYKRTGIFLGGRRVAGQPSAIGLNDDRHVMTVAGSRAGKGVSLLVPNLLYYEGSVLAIDPKGELARITSRIRGTPRERDGLGQKVVILDPFEVSLERCTTEAQREALRSRFGSYNPLDELDPASPRVVDDAADLADALIVLPQDGEKHWAESARRVLKATILLVLSDHVLAERNLITVRQYLMGNHPEVITEAGVRKLSADQALFSLMTKVTDFDGVVAGEGVSFSSMARQSEKELAGILSTARTQTAFLDSPGVRKLLVGSDGARSFRLAELKRQRVTVYLCLPASRMGGSHANWLRVMVARALSAFEAEQATPEIPVLVLLDEFPVLGYMRSLEAAAGQIAGFGVKLWTVLQDLTQLKRSYKESWETFIGNAGVVTCFGNADVFTLDHIAKKLGRVSLEVERPSDATSQALMGGARQYREEIREVAMLELQELQSVLARDQRRMLVLAADKGPFFVERAIYHDADLGKAFAGRFDP